jgi:hypothetical protein
MTKSNYLQELEKEKEGLELQYGLKEVTIMGETWTELNTEKEYIKTIHYGFEREIKGYLKGQQDKTQDILKWLQEYMQDYSSSLLLEKLFRRDFMKELEGEKQ